VAVHLLLTTRYGGAGFIATSVVITVTLADEDRELYYSGKGDQPRELFHKQFLHYMEIMGSTKYSIEQKEEEYNNLADAYFRCKLTDGDKAVFQGATRDFNYRIMMEMMRPKCQP
jgi:hypothetical protein